MTLRPGVTLSSSAVLSGLRGIAKATNLHVSVHGGDRGHNPTGSNNRSEHRIDLGGSGAADFHLFNADGTQVNDATGAELILETGGPPEGTRLLYHGPQTNTEGEHLHLDTRTDKGNAIENRGRFIKLDLETIKKFLP